MIMRMGEHSNTVLSIKFWVLPNVLPVIFNGHHLVRQAQIPACRSIRVLHSTFFLSINMTYYFFLTISNDRRVGGRTIEYSLLMNKVPRSICILHSPPTFNH